jgi:hypothetical protein
VRRLPQFHPESPKRDWKIGDVRGIQEVSISQPIAVNFFSFKYLLIYFAATAAMGLAFILQQSLQPNEKVQESHRSADDRPITKYLNAALDTTTREHI